MTRQLLRLPASRDGAGITGYVTDGHDDVVCGGSCRNGDGDTGGAPGADWTPR